MNSVVNTSARLDVNAAGLHTQNINRPLRLSDFKLIAFDMDSTLINIECIDEMADVAGKKKEVCAITESAMRGEITDFRESLTRRLAILQGLPQAALESVFETRLQLNPGAHELLAACQAAGLKTVLVSGGFTFFAEKVQAALGIDYVRANALEIVDGKITGQVLMQTWGDVVDGDMKRRTVEELCHHLACTTQQAIAVGDGANDLPMMSVAGLSVAYHAKPKVRALAQVAINEGGLDRLLDVFDH